jgi:hypothetical protein
MDRRRRRARGAPPGVVAGMTAMVRKKHYLISLSVGSDLRMHCYLMCKEERFWHAIAEALVERAESMGFRPLPIVLSTLLSDRKSVDVVRKVLSEDEDTRQNLEHAKDYHCVVFLMGAPHDDCLMDLH